MFTYQTLDLIADSYIPCLLACVLICSGRKVAVAQRPLLHGLYQVGQLMILLGLVYGMLLIDNALQLWPSLGLDYSTHTALAIALVVPLWHCCEHKKLRGFWALSLLAYAGLMRYQQYHSWADMIATALYMAAALAAIGAIIRFWKHKA